MTLVTIAMPVYNGADYLDAALESLSRQNFPDMKILISDNASTDKTPEIIAAWQAKDPRITAHRQQENIGALANFNWVLQHAESPWVMFASHDDLWSPNYVTELYQVATSRPDVTLAVPKMILIRPDGSENPRPYDERVNSASGIRRKLFSLFSVTSGWYYGLYKRDSLLSAWTSAQRFKFPWGGDFIVLLPFLLAGSVAGTNEAVYYKRETPLSAARYKPKTAAEQYAFYCNALKVCWLILQESKLPLRERILFTPLLLVYINRCIWKLRRVIRSQLKQLVSR